MAGFYEQFHKSRDFLDKVNRPNYQSFKKTCAIQLVIKTGSLLFQTTYG